MEDHQHAIKIHAWKQIACSCATRFSSLKILCIPFVITILHVADQGTSKKELPTDRHLMEGVMAEYCWFLPRKQVKSSRYIE